MANRIPRDERTVVSRREFTSASVLALLSTVPISIAACGGGGDRSTPAGPSPAPGGGSGGGGGNRIASISLNHGHVAAVTAAQISAMADIVLDIQGQGDHPHTVMITGGELGQIANGVRVSKQSTVEDAHSHIVTFN